MKAFYRLGPGGMIKGKKLDRHYHNFIERNSNLTQECVVVISGKMRVDVFDEEQSFIESFTIVEGEFAIFEAGGHGYEILEENTKIIETKNGPFMGVNIDKTRF